MAQAHAARWIILMKDGDGKWVRSFQFDQPYFSLAEGQAALTKAQATNESVEYKLRRK